MRLLLATVLAVLATPASAQSGDAFGLPPEARARQGEFVAAVVTTDDLEGFVRAWSDGHPQSAITRTAVRGRELKILVLIQGCGAAADGKCNLTGRFTFLLPNGAEYGTINDDNLWKQAPRADGTIQVALGPTLVVDPPDPMGEWTLRAEITDVVRGSTVTVRTPINVGTPPTAAPSR
jgi:hypothetical protein